MRLFVIAFTLLVAGGLSAQKKSAAPSSLVDLNEAIRQQLVAVEVTGTGGHFGNCIKLVCKNRKDKVLRIRIPQGQFLDPSDSTFQTLVVAEERTLALKVKASGELMLKTYCAQAGDRSPMAGAAFAVGSLASEHLRKLLQFIVEKGKTDNSEAQAAVWCITGGGSPASIGDPELAKFTAELMGKAVPVYKIRRKTVEIVPGERAELGKALIVEGNYRYTLEKDEKLLMNLLDAEGKFIKQISKEELMKAGEHRSSFHLEVWNLPPAKYIVRVQTKNGRVIRDIEVEF